MTSGSVWQGHPRLAWVQALHEPEIALGWRLDEWEQVVRLARRLRLLARLAACIDGAGLTPRVPAAARRHLVAELRLSAWRVGAMEWALERVATAIGPQPYPLVLLKGGAYIGQQLPIAAGRLPSDADILVPREHLDDAQQHLEAAGWQEHEVDEHDRRYYREWSHEVPPLHHPAHRVELDLHHNILPPVARTHVDAALLRARLEPCRWPAWRVLHPVDQLLHSAAHLFCDSELRDRLRDLVDLDGLFRHFASPPFWDELPRRADELGLAEPLALACHFCTTWLGTPVPPDTRAEIAARGPSARRRAWLLPLLERLLMPVGPDDAPHWTRDLASVIFLARYHRNRMPMRLLVPHLWRKLRLRARPVDAGPARVEPETHAAAPDQTR